ncbi:MAG: hypothetical protein Q9183_005962 [Haloplaca sp. 2 TL-2023]
MNKREAMPLFSPPRGGGDQYKLPLLVGFPVAVISAACSCLVTPTTVTVKSTSKAIATATQTVTNPVVTTTVATVTNVVTVTVINTVTTTRRRSQPRPSIFLQPNPAQAGARRTWFLRLL